MKAGGWREEVRDLVAMVRTRLGLALTDECEPVVESLFEPTLWQQDTEAMILRMVILVSMTTTPATPPFTQTHMHTHVQFRVQQEFDPLCIRSQVDRACAQPLFIRFSHRITAVSYLSLPVGTLTGEH